MRNSFCEIHLPIYLYKCTYQRRSNIRTGSAAFMTLLLRSLIILSFCKNDTDLIKFSHKVADHMRMWNRQKWVSPNSFRKEWPSKFVPPFNKSCIFCYAEKQLCLNFTYEIVSLNWEISQNEFLIDIVGAIEVVWTTPLIKNINIKIKNFLCDIFHETFPMWNFRCGESRVKCHIYVTLKVDCGIDWTVISLRHQY